MCTWNAHHVYMSKIFLFDVISYAHVDFIPQFNLNYLHISFCRSSFWYCRFWWHFWWNEKSEQGKMNHIHCIQLELRSRKSYMKFHLKNIYLRRCKKKDKIMWKCHFITGCLTKWAAFWNSKAWTIDFRGIMISIQVLFGITDEDE